MGNMFAGPDCLFPWSVLPMMDRAHIMSILGLEGQHFAGEWAGKGGLCLLTQLTHHTAGLSMHLHMKPLVVRGICGV